MRLRRLEFEGVGSFADRMVIDFDVVGAAGMFLVEGPTGSGKSTILDAIVFALYGSVAGASSDPARLDSHVRDRSREPYVELDFACGETVYRIRRTPRHERDKRRGQGTMRDEGGVSLVRLAPDPAALSHKAKEVGDWVIDTIGLTKQQFVATIVLAQGEFAAFLDADTGLRAQILEKVFGTQFYAQVEDELVTMRKAAVRRRADAERAVAETLQRSLGVLGLSDVADPCSAIDTEHVRLTGELDGARRAHAEAAAAHTAAGQRYAAAQVLVRRQQRKRELLQRELELQTRAADIARQRERLSAHDRALPAQVAVTAWRDAHEAALDAREAWALARAGLATLGAPAPDQAALAELADLLGQLRGPAEIESRLRSLVADLQRVQAAADDAQRRAQTAKHRHERLLADLAALQETIPELADVRTRAGELERERIALQAQQHGWERVKTDAPRVAAAGARRDAMAAAWEAAREDADAARQAHLRDQAAALAAELREGRACLVCGATEHPAPAQPAHDVPDLAAAEAAATAAQQQWLEARGEHDRLDAGLQELRQGLRGDAEQIDQEVLDVERRLGELYGLIARAEQAMQHKEQLTAECLRCAADVADVRADAERELARHAAAELALKTAQAQVRAATAEYPCVADRRAALQAMHDAMAAALAAEQRSWAADEALGRAEQVLSQTLAGVGLPDAGAVADAVLEPSSAEQLRTSVSGHDEACAEVVGALRELADVDLGEVVDLDAAADAVATCEQVARRYHERVATLEHVLTELAPLRSALAGHLAHLERVTAETAGVIRMADLATAARGEVRHRVRLSSFVLMRRFEAVVEAANDRLDAISEGRYQLRVRPEGLDKRGQAGLDLVVDDQRTERERSTRSLSGGERFYVSLALALGLADVVRSESGGVHLGTLFIDEGFGSLDPTVLEEVMDMLEQVRAGEDRVIGLVSHVELLKQRIDPRISVRPDPARPAVSTLSVSA